MLRNVARARAFWDLDNCALAVTVHLRSAFLLLFLDRELGGGQVGREASLVDLLGYRLDLFLHSLDSRQDGHCPAVRFSDLFPCCVLLYDLDDLGLGQFYGSTMTAIQLQGKEAARGR